MGTGKSSTMLLPIFPCGRFISVPYVQNTNNTGALRLLIITVSTIASLLNYTFPSWKSWIFLCLVMYEFGPSLGQGSSLFCLGCAEPKGWLGRMHLSEEGRCVHASSASQKKAGGFMEALWWDLEALEEVWDTLGVQGCTAQRAFISACP